MVGYQCATTTATTISSAPCGSRGVARRVTVTVRRQRRCLRGGEDVPRASALLRGSGGAVGLAGSARRGRGRGGVTVLASTSEPSTTTKSLAEVMKATFVSWANVLTSALSNLSAKRVILAIAAKLQLWRIPLLPFLYKGSHLIALVNALGAVGAVSKKTANTFEGLYNNYRNAVVVPENAGVDDAKVVGIMKQILRNTFKEFVDPYTFPSYHDRILEPYNYYNFGQEYVRMMTDFSNSYVGHVDRFEDVQRKLRAGENVILYANHQSEADPGVWALMLERRFPDLAENIVYVAGDRVVGDPLCKPFSMGRNLLCVHSKKYMDEDPETKPAKMKQNRATLSAMSKMLNKGGSLLWIAPSGGRDRPVDDGKWRPADFDETTIALMYRLGSSAKSKTNFYPFAMWSWKIMPPPPKVVVELGEERIINFSGVGVSLAELLDVGALTEDIDASDKAAVAKRLTEKTWDEVSREYAKLDEAIESRAGAAMESQGYLLP